MMTPLAEAGALSHVRVLAFDVDDTVTRSGRLQPTALEAMYRAKDAGLVLVAATGRPIGWAEVFVATWPLDAAIGENGAGLCLPGGETMIVVPDPTVRRARARALVHERHPGIRESSDAALRRVDVAFDVGEHVTLDEATIAAVVTTLSDDGFFVTRSSVHVHAMPAVYDKATGITRALSLLGHPADAVAFVGDSPNDAAAFARFETSFGVANIRAHASRMATLPRFVTPSGHGEGFAEVVDALIAERSRGTS